MTQVKRKQRKKLFKCWQTYVILLVIIVCACGFLYFRYLQDQKLSRLDGFSAGINVKDTMAWDADGKLTLSGVIGEEDFARIASWGMDHVRIPFNYDDFIRKPDEDGLDEDNIKVLDALVSMAIHNGLNVVLDMHTGPGYSHINASTPNGNPFLRNKTLQDQFCTFWRCMAEHYKALDDRIMFDLLNEVVEEPASRWNEIALRAIESIRAVNPEQLILYSGIQSGHPDRMDTLEVSRDPYIVYGIHFYDPILFTHQSDLMEYCMAYGEAYGPIEWHGVIGNMEEFLKDNREFRSLGLDTYANVTLDEELLRQRLSAVESFKRKYPYAKVYCGEFGVIKHASAESKREYLRDLVPVLNELGVGHACWAYTDTVDGWFAFVDWDTKEPLDLESLKICAQKPLSQ